MIKLVFLILSCVSAGIINGQSVSFQTYMNPVIPGDHPDCTLTRVGKDYFTTGSSFNPTPVIYHSTDLVHWTFRETITAGSTPADPPVGAAQTMPMRLFTCMAASARAAAFVCRPPIATRPDASASSTSRADGCRSCIAGPGTGWADSPSSTAATMMSSRRSISSSAPACVMPRSDASCASATRPSDVLSDPPPG